MREALQNVNNDSVIGSVGFKIFNVFAIPRTFQGRLVPNLSIYNIYNELFNYFLIISGKATVFISSSLQNAVLFLKCVFLKGFKFK